MPGSRDRPLSPPARRRSALPATIARRLPARSRSFASAKAGRPPPARRATGRAPAAGRAAPAPAKRMMTNDDKMSAIEMAGSGRVNRVVGALIEAARGFDGVPAAGRRRRQANK